MKALFVINTMTYFSALIDLARFMKKNNFCLPILYFPVSYPTINKDVALCDREKISYIQESHATKKNLKVLLLPLRLINTLIDNLFLISLINKIVKYKKDSCSIGKVLHKTKPDIIVLAGDNVGYNTAMFIKKGHQNNIPSIILPLWMAGANEAAEAYYHDRKYDCKRLTNHLTSLLFPKWVYKYKNKKLLRWPTPTILAMKLFSIDPPVPWALNSGYADVIAVESKSIYNYMVVEGLPANQLKITGSLSNDILAKNITRATKTKKEIFPGLGFNINKPTILCALPPDMLYGPGRTECEFNNYRELVEFWINSIASSANYNVMISLHPSTKYEDVSYIEKKWKVKILQEQINKTIPLCDLFVASISATIQWATACGKPVINYDVYQYHYSDYNKAPGVKTVYSKSDFTTELYKTTNDQKYYLDLKKKQRTDAKNWGMLDGKCGQRIMNLIKELIYSYHQKKL